MILVHAVWARIISSQGLHQIEVIAFEQFAEIAGSTIHVGFRIESIGHAQLGSGSGHELHEALRSFGRNCVYFEAALGTNDAIDEIRIQPITFAGSAHCVGQVHRRGRLL